MTNDDLRGAGTSSNANSYSFTDFNVFNNQEYWYKLTDVSSNGVRADHGPLSVRVNASDLVGLTELPGDFALHNNFPNPFNPKTTIKVDIPELNSGSLFVKINIYNMLGQKVTTLFSGVLEPGYDQIFEWAGDDINGRLVPSGVYIYQIESDQFVQSKKMLLLK